MLQHSQVKSSCRCQICNCAERSGVTVATGHPQRISTIKSICVKPQTAVICSIIDEGVPVRAQKLVIVLHSKLELPSAGIHLMALETEKENYYILQEKAETLHKFRVTFNINNNSIAIIS